MTFQKPSRAASTLTLGMVLLVATTIFAQQLSIPDSADQTTAKLVAEMLTRYHISQPDINDDVSARLLKRYLKELDPQKLYFTQQDVDGFQEYTTRLDDQVKTGNVDFAYRAFDRFLERLDLRTDLAQKLVDQDHDFTADEDIVIDADDLPWARSDDEIHERWRKRIKNDTLTLMLDDTPLKEIRERLHKRYRNVQRVWHQTENSEKLELYLTSLLQTFDPHSSYMSAQTLEDFRISMELSLEGIGAALRSEDGYTIVHEIVPGGAADKDGRLKVGDKIIGVGQEEGEIVDVVEMKLTRVVRLIRGHKGTKVRLQVKTAADGTVKLYELTRQKIELKSAEVKGEILDVGKRLDGRQARIGVIHIPSFYHDFRGARRGDDDFKSTARDVRKVLQDFHDSGGVDVVVIDLRYNGGGALSEAVDVSGLFIDDGPVVVVKEQDGTVKPIYDEENGVAYAGPLVVICNRLSASASEIFAGVIKDYHRGVIVGDQTTHGKGTVQNVMPVAKQLFQFLNPQNRGALKLTINQFYRVNGDSTQVRGVHSDVVLPDKLDHMDLGEQFLDNALKFDHIAPTEHNAVGLVTPQIVSALQQSSQQRIAANPEFQKLEKEIHSLMERKNRKTISLNLETRRKELQEVKPTKTGAVETKKPEEEPGEESTAEGPIFPDNAYNNEILAVAADYVGLVKGLKTAKK